MTASIKMHVRGVEVEEMELPVIALPSDLPSWPKVKEILHDLRSKLLGGNITHKEAVWYLQAVYQTVKSIGAKKGQQPSSRKTERQEKHGRPEHACLWDGLLHYTERLSSEDASSLFHHLLPKIIELALRVDELQPVGGLRVSRMYSGSSTQLSRQFVSSLVACIFLCLFPEQNEGGTATTDCVTVANILQQLPNAIQEEKLRCIIHFLDFVTQRDGEMSGTITFKRMHMCEEPALTWENLAQCNLKLCPVIVGETRERELAAVQIDYANKLIGCNIFGGASLMDDHMILTCPELLAASLFVERIGSDEALMISGFEEFSPLSQLCSPTSRVQEAKKRKCLILRGSCHQSAATVDQGTSVLRDIGNLIANIENADVPGPPVYEQGQRLRTQESGIRTNYPSERSASHQQSASIHHLQESHSLWLSQHYPSRHVENFADVSSLAIPTTCAQTAEQFTNVSSLGSSFYRPDSTTPSSLAATVSSASDQTMTQSTIPQLVLRTADGAFEQIFFESDSLGNLSGLRVDKSFSQFHGPTQHKTDHDHAVSDDISIPRTTLPYPHIKSPSPVDRNCSNRSNIESSAADEHQAKTCSDSSLMSTVLPSSSAAITVTTESMSRVHTSSFTVMSGADQVPSTHPALGPDPSLPHPLPYSSPPVPFSLADSSEDLRPVSHHHQHLSLITSGSLDEPCASDQLIQQSLDITVPSHVSAVAAGSHLERAGSGLSNVSLTVNMDSPTPSYGSIDDEFSRVLYISTDNLDQTELADSNSGSGPHTSSPKGQKKVVSTAVSQRGRFYQQPPSASLSPLSYSAMSSHSPPALSPSLCFREATSTVDSGVHVSPAIVSIADFNNPLSAAESGQEMAPSKISSSSTTSANHPDQHQPHHSQLTRQNSRDLYEELREFLSSGSSGSRDSCSSSWGAIHPPLPSTGPSSTFSSRSSSLSSHRGSNGFTNIGGEFLDFWNQHGRYGRRRSSQLSQNSDMSSYTSSSSSSSGASRRSSSSHKHSTDFSTDLEDISEGLLKHSHGVIIEESGGSGGPLSDFASQMVSAAVQRVAVRASPDSQTHSIDRLSPLEGALSPHAHTHVGSGSYEDQSVLAQERSHLSVSPLPEASPATQATVHTSTKNSAKSFIPIPSSVAKPMAYSPPKASEDVTEGQTLVSSLRQRGSSEGYVQTFTAEGSASDVRTAKDKPVPRRKVFSRTGTLVRQQEIRVHPEDEPEEKTEIPDLKMPTGVKQSLSSPARGVNVPEQSSRHFGVSVRQYSQDKRDKWRQQSLPVPLRSRSIEPQVSPSIVSEASSAGVSAVSGDSGYTSLLSASSQLEDTERLHQTQMTSITDLPEIEEKLNPSQKQSHSRSVAVPRASTSDSQQAGKELKTKKKDTPDRRVSTGSYLPRPQGLPIQRSRAKSEPIATSAISKMPQRRVERKHSVTESQGQLRTKERQDAKERKVKKTETASLSGSSRESTPVQRSKHFVSPLAPVKPRESEGPRGTGKHATSSPVKGHGAASSLPSPSSCGASGPSKISGIPKFREAVVKPKNKSHSQGGEQKSLKQSNISQRAPRRQSNLLQPHKSRYVFSDVAAPLVDKKSQHHHAGRSSSERHRRSESSQHHQQQSGGSRKVYQEERRKRHLTEQKVKASPQSKVSSALVRFANFMAEQTVSQAVLDGAMILAQRKFLASLPRETHASDIPEEVYNWFSSKIISEVFSHILYGVGDRERHYHEQVVNSSRLQEIGASSASPSEGDWSGRWQPIVSPSDASATDSMARSPLSPVSITSAASPSSPGAKPASGNSRRQVKFQVAHGTRRGSDADAAETMDPMPPHTAACVSPPSPVSIANTSTVQLTKRRRSSFDLASLSPPLLHPALPHGSSSSSYKAPSPRSETIQPGLELSLDVYQVAANIVDQVFQNIAETGVSSLGSGQMKTDTGDGSDRGLLCKGFVSNIFSSSSAAASPESAAKNRGSNKGHQRHQLRRSVSPSHSGLFSRQPMSRQVLTSAFLKVESGGGWGPTLRSYQRRSSEPGQTSVELSLQALNSIKFSTQAADEQTRQRRISRTDDDIGRRRRGSLDCGFPSSSPSSPAAATFGEGRRRSSCGFKDPMLSRFAEELMKADTSVPELVIVGSHASSSSTGSRRSSFSAFRDTTLANLESELLNTSFTSVNSLPLSTSNSPRSSQRKHRRRHRHNTTTTGTASTCDSHYYHSAGDLDRSLSRGSAHSLWSANGAVGGMGHSFHQYKSDSSDTEYWFPPPRLVGEEFRMEYERQHSQEELKDYATFFAGQVVQEAVCLLHQDPEFQRDMQMKDPHVRDVNLFAENMTDQILRDVFHSTLRSSWSTTTASGNDRTDARQSTSGLSERSQQQLPLTSYGIGARPKVRSKDLPIDKHRRHLETTSISAKVSKSGGIARRYKSSMLSPSSLLAQQSWHSRRPQTESSKQLSGMRSREFTSARDLHRYNDSPDSSDIDSDNTSSSLLSSSSEDEEVDIGPQGLLFSDDSDRSRSLIIGRQLELLKGMKKQTKAQEGGDQAVSSYGYRSKFDDLCPDSGQGNGSMQDEALQSFGGGEEGEADCSLNMFATQFSQTVISQALEACSRGSSRSRGRQRIKGFSISASPAPYSTPQLVNQIQFVIQWVAASLISCPCLYYHTREDSADTVQTEELVNLLAGRTVGELAELLKSYCNQAVIETPPVPFQPDISTAGTPSGYSTSQSSSSSHQPPPLSGRLPSSSSSQPSLSRPSPSSSSVTSSSRLPPLPPATSVIALGDQSSSRALPTSSMSSSSLLLSSSTTSTAPEAEHPIGGQEVRDSGVASSLNTSILRGLSQDVQAPSLYHYIQRQLKNLTEK